MQFNRFKGLAVGATLALGTFVGGASSAYANLQFTYDPSSLAPAINSAGVPNITANNINVTDYGVVQVVSSGMNAGTFYENTIVQVNSFNLGGSSIPNSSLYQAANGYSLYFVFTGTGTQSSPSLTSATGTFSAGTISLVAANGNPTYGTINSGCESGTTGSGCSGTVTGLSGAITLATGTLTTGTVTLATGSGGLTAGANITTTFIPTPAYDGFFITPPGADYMGLNIDLFGSVTNSGSILTATLGSPYNYLTIGSALDGGGGGDVTFELVPEPTSVMVLGAGLVGLGALTRRRRRSV
jgi:hypothetical protein